MATGRLTPNENSSPDTSRDLVSSTLEMCSLVSKTAGGTRNPQLNNCVDILEAFTSSVGSADRAACVQVLCQQCGQIASRTNKRKGLTNQRLDQEAYSSQSDSLLVYSPGTSRDRERLLFSPLAPMIDHSKLSAQQKRARLGFRNLLGEAPTIGKTAVQMMLDQRKNHLMKIPEMLLPVARLSGPGVPNSHERGDDVRFCYDSD